MRTRIISALLGAPLVIAAILWPGGDRPFPGWPLALLVLALTLVALREFYQGCRQAGHTPRDGFGVAAALLLWYGATPLSQAPDGYLFRFGVTALVTLALVGEVFRRDRAPLQSLGATALGVLYIGWLFPFALRLRLASDMAVQHLHWLPPHEWIIHSGEGAWLLLFTWLVTAAVDTGAYFVGRARGRHRLAPVVSPGKTWEGAFGGFAAGLLLATVLALLVRLPLGFAWTAAALVGVLSQLGDLAKSAIKREIGIKDFGTLIPGHGGVLDRFDSLLFTAPTVYWLLVLWQA